MRFNVKKYIYVLNDFTNLLLQKERRNDALKIKRLTAALIIISILLVLSLLVNVYIAAGVY